jgi:hypothetical protein
LTTHNCAHCGTPFPHNPSSPHQAYCSTKCRKDRQHWLKGRTPKLGNLALAGDDAGLLKAAEELRVKYAERLQSPAPPAKKKAGGDCNTSTPATSRRNLGDTP